MSCEFCEDAATAYSCVKCNRWFCDNCVINTTSGNVCLYCIKMSAGLKRDLVKQIIFSGSCIMPKKTKQPETTTEPAPAEVTNVVPQIKELRGQIKAKNAEVRELRSKLKEFENKLYQ